MLDGSSNSVIQGLTVEDIGDEAIHLRAGSSDNRCWTTRCGARGCAAQFGEGVYVGSAMSNWGEYSGGSPTSDATCQGNNISQTGSESIDIKEGTTGGGVVGNVMDGGGMTGADSLVDIKGNDWIIEGNIGPHAPGEACRPTGSSTAGAAQRLPRQHRRRRRRRPAHLHPRPGGHRQQRVVRQPTSRERRCARTWAATVTNVRVVNVHRRGSGTGAVAIGVLCSRGAVACSEGARPAGRSRRYSRASSCRRPRSTRSVTTTTRSAGAAVRLHRGRRRAPRSAVTPGAVFADVHAADICDLHYPLGIRQPRLTLRSTRSRTTACRSTTATTTRWTTSSRSRSAAATTGPTSAPAVRRHGGRRGEGSHRAATARARLLERCRCRSAGRDRTNWWQAFQTYMGRPIDPGSEGRCRRNPRPRARRGRNGVPCRTRARSATQPRSTSG